MKKGLLVTFILNTIALVCTIGSVVIAFIINDYSWIGINVIIFIVCIVHYFKMAKLWES